MHPTSPHAIIRHIIQVPQELLCTQKGLQLLHTSGLQLLHTSGLQYLEVGVVIQLANKLLQIVLYIELLPWLWHRTVEGRQLLCGGEVRVPRNRGGAREGEEEG